MSTQDTLIKEHKGTIDKRPIDRAKLSRSKVRDRPRASTDRTVGLAEAISAKHAETSERIAADKAKKMTSLKSWDRQAQWKDTFKEHWPDAPALPWTGSARGKWNHAVKRGSFEEINPGEFIEWVIRDWHIIMKTVFKWMKVPPLNPEPVFTMNFISYFLAGYSDRMVLSERLKVDRDEQQIIRLKRQGMTDEEARDRIEKAKKGSRLIQRDREKLDNERRLLEREKQDMARQRRIGNAIASSRRMGVAKQRQSGKSAVLGALPVINFDEEE